MATTVDSSIVRTVVDRVIAEIQFSTIDPGGTITVTLPSKTPKVFPTFSRMVLVTKASSGDVVSYAQGTNWTPGGANTGQTLTIVLDTVAGGNLAGAVVKMYFEWLGQGAGGISA